MALRILIVLLILAVPLELPGCGPFLPQALFFLNTTPESPQTFAAGHLGVLQPTYEHRYQVVAYRYLAGIGLNGEEQKETLPAPPQQDFVNPVSTISPNPWLAARNQVPGVTPLKEIDPYRQVQKQGYFDNYLNCNDDAFVTAATTLQRLRNTPGVKDWIAAQDVVFADCSKSSAIPQPATDPQLRADRAYQIAAAKFYSEKYDEARADFQTIAADSASPWRSIAPYLAARCLIRAGKFADAQTDLQHIVDDPAAQRWHAPATGLLGYVRYRINPPQRMHDLAVALVRPNSQATLEQDLTDYRMLWDNNVKPAGSDDLTDWIAGYQSGGPKSLERWRALHTLPWLVSALHYAKPNDEAAPELLAAAAAVKPDSPAYITVSSERIRLLPPDDGRALADQLLASKPPLAVQNQVRGERMQLARNFEEFLRYAPRTPVAEATDTIDPVEKPVPELDDDSTGLFNRALPVALLKQAQASPLLPQHVREELQHVIFVRSLLLSAAPPFDQVFSLLRSPGMELNVQSGVGRGTPVGEIDDYRDNWWCAADAPNVTFREEKAQAAPEPKPAFLSDGEWQAAAAEAAKFRAAGGAPDWLGQQTLAFARQHPDDPRVPEALHLVVRASRYGCTDPKTGDYSKAAFDLLHSRYPNSPWTRQTPFWFK